MWFTYAEVHSSARTMMSHLQTTLTNDGEPPPATKRLTPSFVAEVLAGVLSGHTPWVGRTVHPSADPGRCHIG